MKIHKVEFTIMKINEVEFTNNDGDGFTAIRYDGYNGCIIYGAMGDIHPDLETPIPPRTETKFSLYSHYEKKVISEVTLEIDQFILIAHAEPKLSAITEDQLKTLLNATT